MKLCIKCSKPTVSKSQICAKHGEGRWPIIKLCNWCGVSKDETHLYHVPTIQKQIAVCFICNDSLGFNAWWCERYQQWWWNQSPRERRGLTQGK